MRAAPGNGEPQKGRKKGKTGEVVAGSPGFVPICPTLESKRPRPGGGEGKRERGGRPVAFATPYLWEKRKKKSKRKKKEEGGGLEAEPKAISLFNEMLFANRGGGVGKLKRKKRAAS